jgi:hypothetical protein
MTKMVGIEDTLFRPSLSMEAASHRGLRSLRIGVITSTYPRSHEDYEVPWLRESVNQIAARGHEVTVIAPSYSGLKNHMIDGTEVRRFRYAPARLEKLTHGEGAPNIRFTFRNQHAEMWQPDETQYSKEEAKRAAELAFASGLVEAHAKSNIQRCPCSRT